MIRVVFNNCIIPFDCDDFSRRALYTLMENAAETRSDHNSLYQPVLRATRADTNTKGDQGWQYYLPNRLEH